MASSASAWRFASVMVIAASLLGGSATLASDPPAPADKARQEKPALSLKASPMMAFAPARIILTAELRGGANDYEEYYCPSVEWEWGDGTRTESAADCDPFEAGKSEIKRRFTVQHEFKYAGSFKIQFRLKRRDRTLTSSHVTVHVRPGFRDPGER
jgi:hypothetical protein